MTGSDQRRQELITEILSALDGRALELGLFSLGALLVMRDDLANRGRRRKPPLGMR